MGRGLILLFLGLGFFTFATRAAFAPAADEKCNNGPDCPENSVCNVISAEDICTCKHGFVSVNITFKPLGDHCDDINECFGIKNFDCGPNTGCVNTPGSYYCYCIGGYQLKSGKRQFKNRTEEGCIDINECDNTEACPSHTECRNTIGSFHCACKSGYRRKASGEWDNFAVTCHDIDECAQDPMVCSPHGTCINTPGRYSCRCQTGFIISTGAEQVKGKFNCKDIDECAQNPVICGPHTTCINTPGSYGCRCQPGFIFSEGGEQLNGTINCTEIKLNCDNENIKKCQNQSQQNSYCSLLNSIYSIIKDPCEKKTSTITLENVTEGFSHVLEQNSAWSSLSTPDVAKVATNFLENVESTILASLNQLGSKEVQQIQTKQMDIMIKVIKDDCNEKNPIINLAAKEDRMGISCRTITGNRAEASSGVAFMSFQNMDHILNGNFFKGQDTNSPETLRDIQINSRVVSGQTTSEKKSGFSDPVVFVLQHLKDKDDKHTAICVYWDGAEGGGSWSPQGCELRHVNRTHTECNCNHLSSFAIIMAISETKEDFTLNVITYIGLTFSLLCLSLAIITFLVCRSIRNMNTTIHLQLCVCLFLAEFLLLTGIKRTSNKTGCAIIAGLLHYFFLACFSWMFLEGLMLFFTVRNLKVVNYFNTRRIKMTHLSLFGYGFPALIVIISAASRPGSYGTDKYCWLDSKTGLVWSFLGPVCAFLLINSCLFATTLFILGKKLSQVNANVSTLKDTRLLTFKASAQLLILGCTWIVGLFQIGRAALAMAYLFTIINSLQGAFILLVHCTLNRQVREEYLRWFKRLHKSSSESQSSGITTSTGGSPFKSIKDESDDTSESTGQVLPIWRNTTNTTHVASVMWSRKNPEGTYRLLSVTAPPTGWSNAK